MPAIIDLYGSGGGIFEYRPALLAAKGFAVLALGFFAYKDLPKDVNDVDLNYFIV
jgi:acyl-coenzyme A thioesterase 1/2/4